MVSDPLDFYWLQLAGLDRNIKQFLDLRDRLQAHYGTVANPLQAEEYRLQIEDLERKLEQLQQKYRRLYDELAVLRRNRAANIPAQLEMQTAAIGAQLQQLQQDLGAQLRELKDAMGILQDQQATTQQVLADLRLTIVAGFDGAERAIITAIVARLDQENLETTQTLLTAIKAGQLPPPELHETLTGVQTTLTLLQQQGKALQHLTTEDTSRLAALVDGPTLDMSHKLELTIPLIPFILTYHTDVGVSGGLNLKDLWKRLTTRAKAEAPDS